MAEQTGIEWTQATWNPWHGCLKVSPGCKNCYMYREKKQYGQDPMVVVRSKTKFNDPLKWLRLAERDGTKLPKTCFTCSWSDFFIDTADPWRNEAWDIIRRTPQIIYQILTKRPERILDHLPSDWGDGYPNVWLGVSVENQKYADERIPLLLRVPAKVRWLSMEPLLEWTSITPWITCNCGRGNDNFTAPWEHSIYCPCRSRLHWVVVGGESGSDSRPMEAEWARSVKAECAASGVFFFMKQGSQANWPKFKDFNSFPQDLQVREYPNV